MLMSPPKPWSSAQLVVGSLDALLEDFGLDQSAVFPKLHKLDIVLTGHDGSVFSQQL